MVCRSAITVKLRANAVAEPLSEEELAQVDKWLKEVCRQPTCEMCGTSNWIVGRNLGSILVSDTHGRTSLGGTSYPAVVVICGRCGNTKLLNAMVLRLMKASVEK